MSLRRLSWSGLAALVPLVVACDPSDRAPPPMPQNQYIAPEPPPPIAPDPSAANNNANGMYASGEIAIGDDSSDAYDDNDPAALTDFRQTLDSHGTWADDPTYGTVWVPSAGEVGPGFTPYATAGHWAYDDDYVWVSDYDWGWAPFHYGRWVFAEGRGWAWIPGREYRGAWVGWGADDGYGYVGWFPLAPAFLWFGGVGVAYTYAFGPRWNYCPHGEIFSPVVGTRLVGGPAAVGLAGRVHAVPTVNGAAMHGPEPSRLGFSAAQIPHATGTSAAGVAKAQQFSRPSTAVAMGAHPAARAATPMASAASSRPSLTAGGGAPAAAGHAGTPGVNPQTQTRKRPTSQGGAAPHAGHATMHPGGGHHR